MVDSIWRYPLKSAQGEPVPKAFIGVSGPDGDRAWACVTPDGLVVSAKNPRRWGKLLYVRARRPVRRFRGRPPRDHRRAGRAGVGRDPG